ncbi:MAG: flagellar export chaperone FliS [Deltaproteobacteria bacterium]
MSNVRQYQNVQVMTADGVRLIIMLYDGVLRFNSLAAASMAQKDVSGRSHYINRSMAIVCELLTSLDMERGGEIAVKLSSLYDFCVRQLNAANAGNDPAALEAVNRVIIELRGGWAAIAADRVSQPEENLRTRSVNCAR